MGSYLRSSGSMQNFSWPPVVMVSDSYIHIRDETERELLFRERFVSISLLMCPGLYFPSIHSTILPESIRIQEKLLLDFREFYGLHSRPNIYPRLLIEFSICHLTEPDRRNITGYETYTTLLSNSRTLLTWQNL
jgi:hypothetical protein